MAIDREPLRGRKELLDGGFGDKQADKLTFLRWLYDNGRLSDNVTAIRDYGVGRTPMLSRDVSVTKNVSQPSIYDKDLQMFREVNIPVDFKRLGFVRYLVERGLLEHAPEGPPSGPFAEGQKIPVAGENSAGS